MRFILLLLLLAGGFKPVAASPLSVEDARHLLIRTGFGASPHALNQLIGMSRTDAVKRISDGLHSDTVVPPPRWTQQPAPHHFIRNQLKPVQRRLFHEAREDEIRLLREWWVREMIETPSPQTEHLVLFWHNHFTSGISALNDHAILIARQHMTIRKHAAGSFRAFLRAMLRDPAMLSYLDNDNNKKSAPNENFARELLELFTLGEGNYQESDIKNVARALTGYRINRYSNLQFQLSTGRHDDGMKTIFNERGTFNGEDVIDLILEQPDSARFIAQKFWHWLVSHEPPTGPQLDRLAKAFSESDYDIPTLYRAVLNSDAFWHADNRGNLIKSPTSLIIGTIRSTGIVPNNWQTIPAELAQLGQQLFDPPNVAGWPGGESWITPSRLLNRIEWLKRYAGDCTGCGEEMTMNNFMQATGATATVNAMKRKSTAREETLLLHMASEEFDEPVRYRVTLFADDTILWTSGERALENGHDTRRFGAVRGTAGLPWRDVHLSIPPAAQRFDTIDIEFLNDANGPGLSRNLYIKYAAFNERHYRAKDGKQSNTCPKIARAKGGNLLCNGTLTLQATAKENPEHRNHRDTLFTSGIYPRYAQPMKKKNGHPAISYLLTDVALADRQWHSLSFHIHNIDQGTRYQLSLTDADCWPQCFNTRPACPANRKPRDKWVLDIARDYQSSCAYTKLSSTEQKLIDTLVMRAPEIHTIASGSRKLKAQQFNNNFNAWQTHIDNIGGTAGGPSRPAAITVATPEQPAMMMQAPSVNARPLAAGRRDQQIRRDMRALDKQHRITGLGQLLLPGGAQGGAQAPASLSDALTNLAYQLH